MSRLLILDFDGTLTDAEEEGRPYQNGYLEDVALLANISIEQAKEWASEFEEDILKSPGLYGWKFNGEIVAPACVDPYLRVMPIARGILDRVEAFTDPDERDRLLDRILYKYNYTKTNTVFRPGAAEFFSILREQEFVENPLYTVIVTNSHTVPVQNKIRELGIVNSIDFDWLIERVQGSARKYVIDLSEDSLPSSLSIPGLNRPIHLRRTHYHSILSQIHQQFSCTWKNTTVLGDIFELDLCLPMSMGSRVSKIKNPFSPEYEIQYLQKEPRGSVHETLSEALNWVLNPL